MRSHPRWSNLPDQKHADHHSRHPKKTSFWSLEVGLNTWLYFKRSWRKRPKGQVQLPKRNHNPNLEKAPLIQRSYLHKPFELQRPEILQSELKLQLMPVLLHLLKEQLSLMTQSE